MSGIVRAVGAHGQCSGLGQQVGPKLLVVANPFGLRPVLGILGLQHTDEVDRERFALMGQLEKGVLRVCSGFAENDHAGRLRQKITLQVYGFTIAFHIQLLDMGRQLGQGGGIGNDSLLGISKICGIPN